MTRINVAIKPVELLGKHLLAEHREIKRIPNCIKSGRFNLANVPDTFRLGTGHVSFFYDKLKYVHERYLNIRDECLSRGYNVSDFSSSFVGLPDHLYNDYVPTSNDRSILKERLISKDESYKTIL